MFIFGIIISLKTPVRNEESETMEQKENKHRALLTRIAHQAMLDRGLQPDFSTAVEHEVL